MAHGQAAPLLFIHPRLSFVERATRNGKKNVPLRFAFLLCGPQPLTRNDPLAGPDTSWPDTSSSDRFCPSPALSGAKASHHLPRSGGDHSKTSELPAQRESFERQLQLCDVLRAERRTMKTTNHSPHKGIISFPASDPTPRSRLQRIQDWETLAKDAGYDPATMSALCPICLRQLERFFMSRFGKSPRSWMLELRCRRARDLIEQGYSNKAVAIELNFANESHLCHAFKKVYGCPPQSFAPLYGQPVAQTQECRLQTNGQRCEECPRG